MRFCPDEIIYTDGSRKEVPGIGIATGSGVYRKLNTAYLKLKVHPYRQGMLNTINRAELVAILVALVGPNHVVFVWFVEPWSVIFQ